MHGRGGRPAAGPLLYIPTEGRSALAFSLSSSSSSLPTLDSPGELGNRRLSDCCRAKNRHIREASSLGACRRTPWRARRRERRPARKSERGLDMMPGNKEVRALSIGLALERGVRSLVSAFREHG